MSFDWAEYLSIAEDLFGVPISGPPPGAEAAQRAAVSRAYYAAFALARNRLRDIDRVDDRRVLRSHQLVAREYERQADPRREQFGAELGRLRAARTRCDYDDDVAELPQLTRNSLLRAARLLAELRQL